MAQEYRIIMTMTFNNPADRDNWYAKVKTALGNSKASSPAYKAAHMTKDDYPCAESIQATEAV